jgi:chaperonin GroEL
MTARLATAGDSTMPRANEAGAIRDSAMITRGARHQPQGGAIEFDSGYLSPYFVTHPERMEIVFENVYILIHQEKINSRKDLLPLLEQIAKVGRPLLIIADDIGGEALAALVVHKLRGSLQVAAVRAPSFGDPRKNMLQDIALLTGAKAIGQGLDVGLTNIQISDLGQASKVIVAKNNTVVEGSWRGNQICFQV